MYKSIIIPVRLTFKGAPGNVGGSLVITNYVCMYVVVLENKFNVCMTKTVNRKQ